jgi:electron transfer flavoprotein beta subunit
MNIIKHITTLVSAGRHPVSGEPRHCHNDSLAMTLGLNIVKSTSAKHHVLHAGNPDNKALTEYLALGAGQVDVIPISDNTDVIDCLAAQLNHVDLILTGSRAESGEDSGLLPYLLAEKLGIPLVVNALAIKSNTNTIEVLQFLPKGKRRHVTVKLPAIIAVHPLAPANLNFSYARQISGEIKSLPAPHPPTHSENDHQAQWQTQAAIRKPIKLKAPESKSGHERMMSAISSESKGGAVVNNGNSVEKAQVILGYLREHHLINF